MRDSMRKLTSRRKTGRTQMGSTLTDPEVDAALQLIQLSGDSADSKAAGNAFDLGKEEEESVGDTVNGGSTADEISSTMNNDDIVADNLDDEACPPRKRKFRSIVDLYLKTKPLLKKQGKKARKN